MLIRLVNFDGVSPKTIARNLPDGFATTALNTKLWNGSLRGYRGPLNIATLLKQGIKKSIYRFGRGQPETGFWMEFTDPVDVVRSPVASMTNERTYWSGEGGMRVTDATLVATDNVSGYPTVSRPVGVPTPTTGGVAAASGVAPGTSTVTDRYLVYTFVNEWGEEGPPSPPSNKVSVTVEQSIIYSNLEVPSGAWTYASKRIYMTNGTGATANFFYLTEIPPGQTSVTVPAAVVDAVPGSSTEGAIALGEPISTTSYLPPPADLHSLHVLPGGVLVGLSDMSVVFSEVAVPYAWPPEYGIQIEHTPIACGVFDQSTVVLTDAYPYVIQGTTPGQMTVRKLESEQACVSARSVVNAGGAVAYASPDGYVLIDANGVQVITDVFFDRDQWQALNPAGMFAVWWDRRFVIFLGDHKGALVIERDKAPVFTDVWADAAYVDPERDALYIARDQAVFRFDGAEVLPFVYATKDFVTPGPANFSVAMVFGKNLDLLMRVFCDDILCGEIPVEPNTPFRLPAGFLGYEHRFELSGLGEVVQLKVAQSMRELRAG